MTSSRRPPSAPPVLLPALLVTLLVASKVAQASASGLPDGCNRTKPDQSVVECFQRFSANSKFNDNDPDTHIEMIVFVNTSLERIADGAFDGLRHLRTVEFHAQPANPWRCDCGIWYLRSWLAKQADQRRVDPRRAERCAGPPPLAGRVVSLLSMEEALRDCLPACAGALASHGGLYLSAVVHGALVLSLVYLVRKLRRQARQIKEPTYVEPKDDKEKAYEFEQTSPIKTKGGGGDGDDGGYAPVGPLRKEDQYAALAPAGKGKGGGGGGDAGGYAPVGPLREEDQYAALAPAGKGK
ncbi:platelet glycoprotein Ib beta chain-like, partial [Lethenteron reissneri]|uniref:platelet glycoprotein Ib beta chain-like n=1 Tax=Lethenteron reissneri TaxID=7753 RepID=UPI002AB68603